MRNGRQGDLQCPPYNCAVAWSVTGKRQESPKSVSSVSTARGRLSRKGNGWPGNGRKPLKKYLRNVCDGLKRLRRIPYLREDEVRTAAVAPESPPDQTPEQFLHDGRLVIGKTQAWKDSGLAWKDFKTFCDGHNVKFRPIRSPITDMMVNVTDKEAFQMKLQCHDPRPAKPPLFDGHGSMWVLDVFAAIRELKGLKSKKGIGTVFYRWRDRCPHLGDKGLDARQEEGGEGRWYCRKSDGERIIEAVRKSLEPKEPEAQPPKWDGIFERKGDDLLLGLKEAAWRNTTPDEVVTVELLMAACRRGNLSTEKRRHPDWPKKKIIAVWDSEVKKYLAWRKEPRHRAFSGIYDDPPGCRKFNLRAASHQLQMPYFRVRDAAKTGQLKATLQFRKGGEGDEGVGHHRR